jgi:putative SOS response-associated peptidase YedK
MCGRYLITSPVDALRLIFGFAGPAPNLPPRWNVAPTQRVPVIRRGADGVRALDLLRWGLVPSWAKDLAVGSRMINARGESVAEKPAYREAFRKRRCLVPADGFYEWPEGPTAPGHPFMFARADGRPFAFAGLWEAWRSPERAVIETFTIVNTEATGPMTAYHHRVPVVLDPADYEAWLDPAGDPAPQVKAPPGEWFVATPVSTWVNDVRHDDPQCVAPYAAPPAAAAPPARPARAAAPAEPDRQGRLF